MGFCDICGCHGDSTERMIDLQETIMKKYYTFSLSYVCDCCYCKLKDYDSGNKKVFKNMNFARRDVGKMFRS